MFGKVRGFATYHGGGDEGLRWAVTVSTEDWTLAREKLGGGTTRAE